MMVAAFCSIWRRAPSALRLTWTLKRCAVAPRLGPSSVYSQPPDLLHRPTGQMITAPAPAYPGTAQCGLDGRLPGAPVLISVPARRSLAESPQAPSSRCQPHSAAAGAPCRRRRRDWVGIEAGFRCPLPLARGRQFSAAHLLAARADHLRLTPGCAPICKIEAIPLDADCIAITVATFDKLLDFVEALAPFAQHGGSL